MKYLLVVWDKELLTWKILTWMNNRENIQRYLNDVAIPRYGKQNLRVMIEQDHAFTDYIQRTKKAAPVKRPPKTIQSDGGSF